MDSKKLRVLMTIGAVVLGGFFLSSMHVEFEAQADGGKRLTIEFLGNKSSRDSVAPSRQSSLDDAVEKTMLSNQKVDDARQLFEQQKNPEVIRLCNEAIELNPDNWEAYVFRGNGYLNIRDYDNALADYEKALALNPNASLAYLNRGICRNKLSQYREAITDFVRAIEIEPLSNIAYYGRAISYGHLGEFDKSLSDFNKAIELDPAYAAAYQDRGLLYKMMGNAAQSERDLKKAAELGFKAPK